MTTKTTSSGVGDLLRRFKNSNCGRSLTTMESGFSLPLPWFSGETKAISFFTYTSRKESDSFQLFPPHAMLSLDVSTSKLIEFSDFVLKPPFGAKTPNPGSPIGVFPHPQIENLKPQGYAKQREKYNSLVDRMSSNDELCSEFKMLFAMLMEPAFATYYWAISPPKIRSFMAPVQHQEPEACP